MATEIELKAHVRDSEDLRLLLTEKAEYINAFEKADTYWLPAVNHASISYAKSPAKIRVRRETRTLPDGTVESAALVTYKTKEVRDGIEINDELEFEVSSGPAFEELLERMGFKPDASKRKKGWAFSKEGITAELSEVGGNPGNDSSRSLGWFIELEILADNSREETVAQGRQRLTSFLSGLGIEKEAIESRHYTEMLGEN